MLRMHYYELSSKLQHPASDKYSILIARMYLRHIVNGRDILHVHELNQSSTRLIFIHLCTASFV